ncbi:CehA/McbA family metallohydrolase [bacterium]|nr:CehA/McbA family metallohydrolase [bacterium]
MLTYAEIHYRPRFVPSLIFRKWPEILCDAPARIDRGRPVPVFIIIRDAHKYPVRIEMVTVHLVYESGMERVAQFPYGGITVNEQIWWDSINIMPEYQGNVSISVTVHAVRGKSHSYVNVDNYSGTTHSPLTVYVSPYPLPGDTGWFHGDIHCHTFYTADQVEFGAPLEVMAFAAYCMGLHWLAATDHSYDLDDRYDDYATEDPDLIKWQLMKKQTQLLSPTLTVIPGEEVTCRTYAGLNCHMLALVSERFIRGSGDSGERGLHNETELAVSEAVRECSEWNGIACAAHPLEHNSLLERLILSRGVWTQSDLELPGLTALQIHNGIRDKGFYEGMKAWIRLLLMGRKVYAFGGSDAHGDMNRRRRTTLPLCAVGEDGFHTFGAVRTVLYAPSSQQDHIIEALRNGRAQVTEGPFIHLTVSSGGTVAGIGDCFSGSEGMIQAVFRSSPEFGYLKSGCLMAGTVGESCERILALPDLSSPGLDARIEKNESLKGFRYIRAECETVSGKYCFTNPVWIENSSG